ncbi:hypothetical protein WR25_24121 [Diploscapter pachys]|uniref:Uncharacterized protein n=1 Tax=Diploscapter pachys TaxID=2018661 RepID=A0A2A2K1R3_9BILA|nr:hypothetical protein WR25_24121 [Diploscapter pachys]
MEAQSANELKKAELQYAFEMKKLEHEAMEREIQRKHEAEERMAKQQAKEKGCWQCEESALHCPTPMEPKLNGSERLKKKPELKPKESGLGFK